MQSLFDHVRAYQNSHDCSDDDMLRILCDAVECSIENASIPSGKLNAAMTTDDVIEYIKDLLPIQEDVPDDGEA